MFRIYLYASRTPGGFLIALSIALMILIVGSSQSTFAAGQVFYVDAVNGSDSNSGSSPEQAWRSPSFALGQNLQPGDIVLFRRGQLFSQTQTPVIQSSGFPGNPIVISSYGEGSLPTLENTNANIFSSALRVNGNYVQIDNLHMTNSNEYGIVIYGDFVVVKNVEIDNVGIGIGLHGNNALIQDSYIHDLRMIVNDSTPGNDYGAMGILVANSSNTVINRNRFINIIHESMDFGTDGAPLEVFAESDLNNVTFSHNYIENCDNVFEAGSTGLKTITGIYVHHNIIVDCNGVVIVHPEGSGGSFEVKVDGIYFDNNTVKNSNLVWVEDGIPPYEVYIRNNIFIYDTILSGRHNGNYVHYNNIYYADNLVSESQIGVNLDESERIIDPLLNNDFTLHEDSPAIDQGSPDVNYPTVDYRGALFPQGVAPDIGAFEVTSEFWLDPVEPVSVANPTYRWKHFPAATAYEIYLAVANQSFTPGLYWGIVSTSVCSTICSVDLTTQTNNMLPGVSPWLPAGSYAVFISPKTASGSSLWYGPFHFDVIAEPPGLPNFTGVTDGNMIHWSLDTAAARASWFQLYLAPTDDMLESIASLWITRLEACGSWEAVSCSYTLSEELTTGEAYTLYMQSWGAGGLSKGGNIPHLDSWSEFNFIYGEDPVAQ